MEPQIRYATTSDGVSIAYSRIGDGPPLIGMSPGIWESIAYDWKMPNLRAIAEASARFFTYVRYDPRGSGLSDRHVSEFSIDAMGRDLEAVADALPAEQFALFAPGSLGMAGTAFAARHPDRVSRLVLWSSCAHGADIENGPLRQIRELAQSDWRLASEAMFQAVDNWANPEIAQEYAAMMRASVEPATYLRSLEAMRTWDLSGLLAQVACPTLVINPKANAYAPVDNARRLATGILGARLALVENSSVLMPDMEVARLAGLFLSGRDERGPRARPRELPQGTAVILFADIVDSTALTELLGDMAFRERARDLDAALRAAINDRGGTTIDGKLLGDGVLAVFSSAAQAIEAARHCAAAGDEGGLPLHLGIHAGDVIQEKDNVFGGAVNIASRIASISAPGEILVSATVRELARTSAGVQFDDRGEHALKGVADAVRLFEVR